jgi:RNA polymerase sigma-70 factor (ECF subfamily)
MRLSAFSAASERSVTENLFAQRCNGFPGLPTVFVCRSAPTIAAVASLDFSDDAVLVKALAMRDSEAFAYLLDQYHAPLVRLAQQYVPSRAVADEVVQETWLAVIQGIDRFEQRSSLKTWLFHILVNIARTHGVKENRAIPFATNALLEREPAVDPSRFKRFGWRGRGQWTRPPQPWSDPEQRALDGETLTTIETAVERLPSDQREVLTMRDLLGWSPLEVCAALTITDANQRVLLHRARSKVRAALERQYDEGREA